MKIKIGVGICTFLIVLLFGSGFLIRQNNKTISVDKDIVSTEDKPINQELIREFLQEQVDENEFGFTINTEVEFENNKSDGNWFIENYPENKNDLKVIVRLKDKDDIIFESQILPPGANENLSPLSKPLPKGSYEAEAEIIILNEKGDFFSSSFSELNITIKN